MRIFSCIFFFLLLSSCGIKLGRNDRVKRNIPSISMQNFLYTYTTERGFREWEIKSVQANIFEDKDLIFLYNFTMTFFSKTNTIHSILVANQGTVKQIAGHMTADGEVRVFASNSTEILTEKIYWDQDREIFYSESDKLVTMIRPRHKITGYNMLADSALENVILQNSIGRIQQEKVENGHSKNEGGVSEKMSPKLDSKLFVPMPDLE